MRVVDRPSIKTSPAVGRSSNPNRYSSDDLPEPDGPVIATNSRGTIETGEKIPFANGFTFAYATFDNAAPDKGTRA